MNNAYFDDPDFEEGYAGGINTSNITNPFTLASIKILAMSDDELAKLFAEIADEPEDPFFRSVAECFIGNIKNT